MVTVDMSVKTDDGWLWGECQGRTGVFPAGYADKLTDLEQELKIFKLNIDNNFLLYFYHKKVQLKRKISLVMMFLTFQKINHHLLL